jgi:hypothetical protein
MFAHPGDRLRDIRHTIASGLMSLALLGSASAHAETYRVPNFGFTVRIPPGTRSCSLDQAGQDHGPLIALDPRHARLYCSDVDPIRFVSVSGWDNVLEDISTLPAWLKFNLDELHGRRVAAPPGVRFSGPFPTASAQVDEAGGWVDVVVVTQRPAHPTRERPNAAGVNYEASLHTDKAHYAADLRVFRSILASVRWATLD